MNHLDCQCIKGQRTTRNIRKPGDVAKLYFCTFTQNCNGLIGLSFEIPAYAYCQPLPIIQSPSLKKVIKIFEKVVYLGNFVVVITNKHIMTIERI